MPGAGFGGRPLLRGVSHQVAFFVSVIVGAALIAGARAPHAHLAAVVFAVPIAFMFGVSALYHRGRWSGRTRPWLRRIDHSAIFLVIGGSYTAYGLIALDGAWRSTILTLVWAGVVAGIAIRFLWLSAPGWLTVGVAIGLGWISVVVVPQVLDHVGGVGLALLVLGGVLYSVGGIVYALRRPDPLPRVFGFHEVFHALVIAAVACQYASVAFFLLPRA
ncbi:MAG: hemolysin III family protein [Gaiellales bacterium]